MSHVRRGRVQDGGIIFAEPVELPNGTEVVVGIEPLQGSGTEARSVSAEAFEGLPFFGMWADRDEMREATEWVERQRDQWANC